MASAIPPLEVSFHQQVALVTFNLQDMRAALMSALVETIDQLEHMDDVRAVVFTGRRNMFLSGAHLKDFHRLDSEPAARAALEIPRVFARSIAQTRKITIAAINGFCIGGGLELATACDFRVCVDQVHNASGASVPFLGFPEVALGVIPPLGGTFHLPRIIGLAKAKEMMLTGSLLSAQQALPIGLVNQLAPADAVVDRALALARQITTNAAPALAAVKHLLNSAVETDNLADALDAAEDAFAACTVTTEKKERIAAALNNTGKRQRKKVKPTPSTATT